jgi:putative aldouronate transport system permease protein
MYGLQIAFKDYSVGLGILKSPWVGLKHLNRFVSSFYFKRVIGNTLSMSVYSLLLGIPAPLILALLFDELRGSRLKTVCQMFSYAPNFISVVVLCSMTIMFLTPGTGFIDAILRIFGYSAQTSILASPVSFNHIYAWTGVWQTIGWNSVIYTAALAGTSPELYEVARLDGASRLKQIWHVTIPSILPTIVILAIMAIGNVLNVGYEKVFLLQNTSNLSASEVISTYVFKTGLEKAQYSFASMVGLFNNVINFAILILANFMSRRLTETALW